MDPRVKHWHNTANITGFQRLHSQPQYDDPHPPPQGLCRALKQTLLMTSKRQLKLKQQKNLLQNKIISVFIPSLFVVSFSFQTCVQKFFPIKCVSAVRCVSSMACSFCTRKAAPIQSDWHHGHGMLKSTFFPFSKEKRPFKANQLEMSLCFYFPLNFLEPIMELSGMYI